MKRSRQNQAHEIWFFLSKRRALENQSELCSLLQYWLQKVRFGIFIWQTILSQLIVLDISSILQKTQGLTYRKHLVATVMILLQTSPLLKSHQLLHYSSHPSSIIPVIYGTLRSQLVHYVMQLLTFLFLKSIHYFSTKYHHQVLYHPQIVCRLKQWFKRS